MLKKILPWTQTPPSLLDAVRRTLKTLQQGKDPDSVASKSHDTTFGCYHHHYSTLVAKVAAAKKRTFKIFTSLYFAAFAFCQQVTPQQYEDRREAATLEGLKQLLCEISSNQTLPAKERRRLLKEFEKHHPVVFLKHLSSTFWKLHLHFLFGTAVAEW